MILHFLLEVNMAKYKALKAFRFQANMRAGITSVKKDAIIEIENSFYFPTLEQDLVASKLIEKVVPLQQGK
jgi:hypothetical protein